MSGLVGWGMNGKWKHVVVLAYMNSIIQYCYYVKGKNPQDTLPLYWEPVKMVYDKVVGKIQNAKWILSLHVKKN